jgi:hypothetical protein
VLGGKERRTGMRFATAVPTKGASGRFSSDKALQFMEEIGDKTSKVIVKTDQEPSIKYLINDIVEGRPQGQTLVELSPVKSSGSNGIVEKSVQEIEGQLRAILLALEARVGRELNAKEPIVTFMPEYSAYLLNRRDVGLDGKTAYERNKGKKASVLGLEFGEKLLYKVKTGDKMQKINSRWELGIFVGVRQASGELWVAVKDRVFEVRSVRRIPVEDRWSEDNIKWVNRAPWNRYKECEFADGDAPEEVEATAKVKEDDGMPRMIVIDTSEKQPREFYIKKTDAEKHGYTRGCGGCTSWFRGLARQPHSEECRQRFRELMKEDARVVNAEGRRKDFEKKELEKRKPKRKAEDDGDQDDDLYHHPGEEARLEEVVVEECQDDRWLFEVTERIKKEQEAISLSEKDTDDVMKKSNIFKKKLQTKNLTLHLQVLDPYSS